MAMDTRHHHLPTYLAAALFLAFSLAPPAAAQRPWQVCGSSGNYTLNDTYQNNIGSLSATLPKDASSSPTLFAKAAVGAVPDIVYALALCRGDSSNATACGSCVAAAFQAAQQLCAYDKDATVYYDACYLRFSNQDFLTVIDGEFFILRHTGNISTTTSGKNYVAVVVELGSSSNGNELILMSSENVSSPINVFDAAVRALLNATADYSVVNSTRLFATVEGAFDAANPTIYGLTQCTPDMSPADCRTCLGGIISMMPQYLSGSQGGRVLGVRCNFRYEVYSFFTGGPSLRLPAPSSSPPLALPPAPINVTPPTATPPGNRVGRVLPIVLPIVVMMLAIIVVCYCFWRRKRKPAGKLLLIDSTNPEDIRSIDSLIIDLAILRATTENFDEGKKLGEGGFGAVYKGVLPNGREIAVKRLSQSSRQGIKELKTELVLVAKLQHKNLVRLIGVCLEEHEKLLVYEYMPNNSLDTFLFDPDKSSELDWEKRFMIINGIAQGLQYLHEESQLKIVHRDLKASNVLLDSHFNPKISDFGLARLFGNDQSKYVTNRVVGTYGYMAPEYAMRGHYSTKSDVFSFGVLMLEIVAGRRNSGSYESEQYDHLLSLVWGHWTMGTIVEIMDSSLSSHPSVDQMLKCIHIGLLCVQHNPADRPTMSTVNLMLSSSTVPRQAPSRPAFCFQRGGVNSGMYSAAYSGRGISQSTSRSDVSENEVTITELEGR
ncbi:unnamed protein product [Urochloa decumbens]|uniref:Cysteine-rich receptor-like protein kinase 10 n=1 Tax=Urochloa decumbens TaxID=240449 RepID=A0ABC9FYK9_9POAL